MTEFIKSATKKSLLAIVKEPLTPRSWARLFEALVTKDELQDYVVSSVGDSTADTKKQLEGYVKRDGTTELTGDWDAGSYEIKAETLESDVATGTAPLTIASTTLVDNLNADTVDGSEEAVFAYVDGTRSFTGDVTIIDSADPAIFLRESGSASNYTKIYDDGDSLFNIVKYTAGNDTHLYFSPIPSNGTSAAKIHFFYNTVTTGDKAFILYDGSAGQNVRHELNVSTGDVDLCQSAGEVTIGGTGGSSRLTVVGSIAGPVTTQTGAALTLTGAHFTVLCDTTNNAVTITLPTAVGAEGRMYNIKCIDATNTCELAADGTEEIDGSTTNVSLVSMETVTVQSDNANWWII